MIVARARAYVAEVVCHAVVVRPGDEALFCGAVNSQGGFLFIIVVVNVAC